MDFFGGVVRLFAVIVKRHLELLNSNCARKRAQGKLSGLLKGEAQLLEARELEARGKMCGRRCLLVVFFIFNLLLSQLTCGAVQRRTTPPYKTTVHPLTPLEEYSDSHFSVGRLVGVLLVYNCWNM